MRRAVSLIRMRPYRSVRRLLLGLTLLAGAVPAPGRAAPSPAPAQAGLGNYLCARFAASEADLDAAAAEFLQALTADPDNLDLQQQAFLAAALAGRPEASQLARNLPSNPAAQMFLANEDAVAGRWTAAETRFATLPRTGLVQVLQPLLVAWTQQGGGRVDAALATLRSFAEGTVRGTRGVYALHAALISDLANRIPDAGRLYRAARTEYGALNLRLAQELASWQARQNHPIEATAILRTLVADAPDLAIAQRGLQAAVSTRAVPRAADGLAEAYLAVAASLHQPDAPDTSLLMLRFALTLRPDLTAARLLMSDLQVAAKHPEAALATLASLPENDPLSALVRLHRAVLEAQLGQTDAALRGLDQLAREVPDSPAPLAEKGDLLRVANRYGEAVRAYDEAIARLGQGSDPTGWALYYARGMSYDRLHDWHRAEADLRHALRLSPNQPSVLNYLGYSLAEQNRNLPEARQMVLRALQVRPSEGAIVDSLGWIMLRQGQYGEAVTTLTRAVGMEPEDPVINGHLGDAQLALGHVLDATYQWQLALTFHPTPEDAAALRAKLDRARHAADQASQTAAAHAPTATP